MTTPLDLTPSDVHDRLVARQIVLIDVREPAEYASERIHGALNAPLSTFDPDSLPAGGPRAIVLQCGSGKRSAMAMDLCRKAGVEVAGHLDGGIAAWRSADLPVVRIDPATGAVRDAR